MKNLSNLQLSDYMEMLKGRIFWILVPAVLTSICTFFYVRTLPDRYTSETVILVTAPKIGADYVRPTNAAPMDQRLTTITQQILSRTRLEKIILENNLYPEKRHWPMEQVVQDMRRVDVTLRVMKADAFAVGYVGSSPAVAQKVAAQIASMYIEENVKLREEQTEGVSQFLDLQLQETKTKLQELEARLGEFKHRNIGALPEQQTANLSRLAGLQQQLQASIDSVNRLEDQRLYHQRSLDDMKALVRLQSGSSPPVSSSATEAPTSTELEAKKAQRDVLLERYTPDHPDVRKLDKEIARIKSKVETAPVPKTPSVGKGTDKLELDEQLTKAKTEKELQLLDGQILHGRREQERIRSEMATYEDRVEMVPRIEQMQKEISRDYEITKLHYQTLLTKKNEAAMATNLEKRQKGEQFRIVDPAYRPGLPSEPNRLKLNLMGLAVGLALGFGLALLLELCDESIRSEHELVGLTGLPVLVAIPLISGDAHKPKSVGGGRLRAFRKLLFPHRQKLAPGSLTSRE